MRQCERLVAATLLDARIYGFSFAKRKEEKYRAQRIIGIGHEDNDGTAAEVKLMY